MIEYDRRGEGPPLYVRPPNASTPQKPKETRLSPSPRHYPTLKMNSIKKHLTTIPISCDLRLPSLSREFKARSCVCTVSEKVTGRGLEVGSLVVVVDPNYSAPIVVGLLRRFCHFDLSYSFIYRKISSIAVICFIYFLKWLSKYVCYKSYIIIFNIHLNIVM